MGEIGINHHTALDTLRLWQIRAIIRGYQKRHREQWHQTRFLAWIVANGFGGKIDQPEELVTFSWEEHQQMDDFDADELQRMVEEAREHNRKLAQNNDDKT